MQRFRLAMSWACDVLSSCKIIWNQHSPMIMHCIVCTHSTRMQRSPSRVDCSALHVHDVYEACNGTLRDGHWHIHNRVKCHYLLLCKNGHTHIQRASFLIMVAKVCHGWWTPNCASEEGSKIAVDNDSQDFSSMLDTQTWCSNVYKKKSAASART